MEENSEKLDECLKLLRKCSDQIDSLVERSAEEHEDSDEDETEVMYLNRALSYILIAMGIFAFYMALKTAGHMP